MKYHLEMAIPLKIQMKRQLSVESGIHPGSQQDGPTMNQENPKTKPSRCNKKQ